MKRATAYRFRPMGTNSANPILVVLLSLGLSGCYSYLPVDPAVPTSGQIVRADINDDAAARLTSQLGPGVTEIQGMVLRQEDQALSVLVQAYTTFRAGELTGFNEPVLLPYPEIRGLTLKTFSKKRSVLFGAAFAGAALLTATAFGGLDKFFDTQEPDTVGQPEMRRGQRLGRPSIGIRIPFGFR